MADNTKTITEDSSVTSEWHKGRKRHHESNRTPRTSNRSWGWSIPMSSPVRDADGDFDNDTPGGVDTDNDAGTPAP
jgi:hypothetical protein